MSQELYVMNRRNWFLETLFRFLDQRTAWKGSPSDLSAELQSVALHPGTPEGRGIQGILDDYQRDISAAGWKVTSGRARDGRWIALRKTV